MLLRRRMGVKTTIAAATFFVLLFSFGGAGIFYWLHLTAKPKVAIEGLSTTAPGGVIAGPAPRTTPDLTAPTAMSVQDQAALAAQLASKDARTTEGALRQIRALAKSDPRSLAAGLPLWLDPLLSAQDYQDIEQFAPVAILGRAADTNMVEDAQRALVLAMLAEGKYSQVLSQAKSYYDIASLAATGEAVGFVSQALDKIYGAAVANQFKLEQIAAASSGGASPALAKIHVDAADYGAEIARLGRGSGMKTHGNLMERGNLLLLADRPAEARVCFEAACRMSGSSGKDPRGEVEGVAKSIRDLAGSTEQADGFILSLRQDPSILGSTLIGASGMPSLAELQKSSNRIPLAQVQMTALPPLEQARAEAEKSESSDVQVQFVSGFECSTPIDVKQLSPTHFEVSVTMDYPDWFMFRIQGVAGKTVRIDLTGQNVSWTKWASLNPVYGDVEDLDDRASFAGTDIPGQAARAWNGPLLPSTDAQKWHYISNVWQERSDALSFVQRFDSDSVYIAMRVPFTPGYNERYLRSLTGNSRVSIVEVGRSMRDRPLLLAKIGAGGENAERTKPCVLVYAREHADEQDCSWAAQGVIEYLLSDQPAAANLRERFTFLVIPMLDPDAAVESVHQAITASFYMGRRTAESSAYANWFQGWVNAGKRLDVVFDLHNVQSAESPAIACAMLEGEGERGSAAFALHSLVLDCAQKASYSVRRPPTMRGISPDRLGGWLTANYGALTLAYELNAQVADRHSSLSELKNLGAKFADAAGEFLASPDGIGLLANIDARRQERLARWAKFSGTASADEDAIESEAARLGQSEAFLIIK